MIESYVLHLFLQTCYSFSEMKRLITLFLLRLALLLVCSSSLAGQPSLQYRSNDFVSDVDSATCLSIASVLTTLGINAGGTFNSVLLVR